MPPAAWIILPLVVYAAGATAAALAFSRMARAGTAHLDRPLPADWAGSHPFMPGGSPTGEEPRS